MCRVPTYFLGANSPRGFYSLYDQLLPPRQTRAVWLLKGGPGCGKSTLMKRVEGAAREAGLEVERILCSGDPDSLDALVLPELGAAIADATAPHVLEPKLPGVVERYVDLGSCYDSAALRPLREEIAACMTGYPACYRRAYRCLEAVGILREDARATLLTPQLQEKLARRARGIVSRELKPKCGGDEGRVKRRFLSAVTHKGLLLLRDTVECQCDRVFVLEDPYGLGHDLLAGLLAGAAAGGYDTVACPDPMAPERLLHILIPERQLAFVTATPSLPWRGKVFRRLRLDSAADPGALRACRARLRFSLKVAAALEEEAVGSLAQAKQMHDELEGLYNPHVDFDRVNEIADGIAGEIMGMQNAE